jgi:CGA synthase-related protein
VLQLSVPRRDSAAAHAAGGVLREAAETARRAGLPVLAVVLDAPERHRAAILAAAGPGLGTAELHPDTTAAGARDRLLAEAALLMTSPLLTGVNQASAARVPAVLLPALNAAQAGTSAELTALGIAELPPGGAGGARAVRTALDTGAELWAALDAAGDDRRGAQRVARQVRQLLLAPV